MSDLLADAVAELYEADPDGFTERRAELAAAARDAGEPTVAKQITALRKPTRSAWVVNRLVRSDPEVRSRLDALAADLRAAAGSADGGRIRELTAARARLVDELTRAALRVSELPAPPAALREEVTATLDAAIADPEVAANLGTLVRAAHWSGFGLDSLSGAIPAPAPARPGHPETRRRLRPKPSARTAAGRRSWRPNGPWLKPTRTSKPPPRPNTTWKRPSATWKPNSPTHVSAWPRRGGSPTGRPPGSSERPGNSVGSRSKPSRPAGGSYTREAAGPGFHPAPPYAHRPAPWALAVVVEVFKVLASVEVLPVDGHPSEPDGFRDFVEARSSALLRSGWLLTGDWPSAEDLVQTALAAAWPRWATLTRQDAPELYVRKIMVNTFLRWRQRRWNGEIATGRLPEQAYGDVFAQVDARQALIAALDRLPARQRAVVVLRYFADQTEAQTAAAMGCSVGAVKSHASKALARLRDAPGLAELMTGGVAS